MIWSSGFDRPALRRRMVTKREKYSMYRTANNLDTIDKEIEEETFLGLLHLQKFDSYFFNVTST